MGENALNTTAQLLYDGQLTLKSLLEGGTMHIRLGRYATTVQTRATHLVLLDNHHL